MKLFYGYLIKNLGEHFLLGTDRENARKVLTKKALEDAPAIIISFLGINFSLLCLVYGLSGLFRYFSNPKGQKLAVEGLYTFYTFGGGSLLVATICCLFIYRKIKIYTDLLNIKKQKEQVFDFSQLNPLIEQFKKEHKKMKRNFSAKG